MSGIIVNLLIFIVGFGLLVFLHELGHFLIARLFKVEVEEFGFGFPPRMVKLFRLGGTDFTLNWIPFGAFVRPKGESDDTMPGGMAASSPWVRLSILLGGPVMNIVVGILIFSIVFLRLGAPDTKTVQIMGVVDGAPAAIAGLKQGDIIQKVNDQPIKEMAVLSSLVRENAGKEITIVFTRDGQNYTIHAVPRQNPPPNQGALGITMGNPMVKISWFQALPYAGETAFEQGRQLFLLPGRLIRGEVPAEQARIVGPIGIYNIYTQAAERDQQASAAAELPTPAGTTQPAPVNKLALFATISIALGLTNLLPIPALDGGRIVFVLLELIMRRRVPQQYENVIHMVGFTVLILLMVFISRQDIINPIKIP